MFSFETADDRGRIWGTFDVSRRADEYGDTVLVTALAYNARGELFTTTDPAGRAACTQFDDAGRTVAQVQNANVMVGVIVAGTGQSDQNVSVLYSYTPDGKLATLTAVNSATGDQVTQYVYGATLVESSIARSDLLRAEIYPDSDNTADPLGDGPSGVYDRVEYAYNRAGQVVGKTDQNGTVHQFVYDGLGRLSQDCVTAVGNGIDSAVLSIACGYEVRGILQSLTSYDNATPAAGNVVNDVQLLYNAFGQLTADYQSHSGPVDMASTPSVGYNYEDGSSGTIRRTGVVYPNGRLVGYQYAAGADDAFNRVTAIVDGDSASAPVLAQYTRLGLNRFVQTDYPQPSLRCDLAFGDGPDPNVGLDQFGRIVDLRWWNPSTGQDVERVQHGYDLAGNRLWRQNPVAASLGVPMDELYSYDGVNQLTSFARGQLTSDQTALGAGRSFQYPQLSCRTGRRFSACRLNCHLGMKRSIRATKRGLCVGSRRWINSCTTTYSRHSRGFFARSVLSRMLAEAGLQLPHWVFIRCTKNFRTVTPSSGSHFATSARAASLSCWRYQRSRTASFFPWAVAGRICSSVLRCVNSTSGRASFSITWSR
jgi:YD repeat-containing protein